MRDSILSQLNLVDKEYVERCRQICEKTGIVMSQWLILVNVQSQRLHLIKEGMRICSYLISTGANGVGQEMGSEKTPLGLHEVHSKIGDGANSYAVFKSRQATGEVAVSDGEIGHITTRILTLKGLEESFNKGKTLEGVVVDSLERYIYIHGTNKISGLGRVASKGCICMHPEEMIDLFEQVSEGTLVYIY